MRVKIGDGSGCLPVSNSALSSGLGLSPFVESCRSPSLEPWETGISPRKFGRVSTPDGWIVPWLWCRGFQHASASDGEAGCRGSSGYWPASVMRTSSPRSRRPAAASCSPPSPSTSCTGSSFGTPRPRPARPSAIAASAWPGTSAGAMPCARSSRTSRPRLRTSSTSTACWPCAACPIAIPAHPANSSGNTAATPSACSPAASRTRPMARWRCRGFPTAPRRGSSSCTCARRPCASAARRSRSPTACRAS